MEKNIVISTRNDLSSVIGWIDAKSNIGICYLEDFQLYRLVSDLKQVSDCVFFYLVLESKKQSSFIREMLINEGFSNSQIIDFYSVFNSLSPLMVVDKLLENPIKKNYKAVVLGISHSQVDIVPEAMNVDTVNFAVSSQDLYYNFKTLEYALHRYPDRFSDLEYLIIDMYNYNYFNVDLSRGKRTYEYLKWGGYNKDEHNFELNKNYDCSFSELNDYVLHERYEGIERETINRWHSIFAPKDSMIRAQLYTRDRYFHYRNNIISDEIINIFYYDPANVKKRFEDTITENVDCFANILKMAREFNPDIKIVVCLLPIYCEVWEREKEYYLPWKEDFENIIEKIKKQIPFTYLDLREHEMSLDRIYWQDAEHLNYYGALKFTEYLNDILLRG